MFVYKSNLIYVNKVITPKITSIKHFNKLKRHIGLRKYAKEEINQESLDDEERLELLEAKAVKRKSVKDKEISSINVKSEEKEKNWTEKTLTEKLGQFYMGEKGLLFWINRISLIALVTIIVSWICFRFVGPFLGFYQLK